MTSLSDHVSHARVGMWVMLAAAGIASANFLWGEVTLAGGGVGWDGRLYAQMAESWPDALLKGQIEAYYVRRLLPSAIVATALRLLGVPLTTDTILFSFRLLNSVLFITGAAFWTLAARASRLSARGTWIGFALLFISYAALKQFTVLPLNTDQTAFTIAIAMLYFVIAKSRLALLGLSILAAFCWPTAYYGGLLLFASSIEPAYRSTERSRFPAMAAALATAAIGWLVVDSYYVRQYKPPYGTLLAALPLSFIVPMGLILTGLFVLLCPLSFGILLRNITQYFRTWRLYAAIGLAVAIETTVGYLGAPTDTTAAVVLRTMAVQGLAAPGIAFIAHSVYYGPLILLAILNWKRITDMAYEYGFGMVVFLAAHLLQLSLDSESRREVLIVPFLALFVAHISDRQRWPSAYYGVIAALCFLYSKVWMLFNAYGLPTAEPQKWPMQMLFMNLGPWMLTESYVSQGAVVVVTLMAFIYMRDRLSCLQALDRYKEVTAQPGQSSASRVEGIPRDDPTQKRRVRQ